MYCWYQTDFTVIALGGRPPRGESDSAHSRLTTSLCLLYLSAACALHSNYNPQHPVSSMLNYVMLVSRQGMPLSAVLPSKTQVETKLTFVGKVRLAKWFQTLPSKQKSKIIKDVTQLVLARRTRMCNFLEYKGQSLNRWSVGLSTSTCSLYLYLWDVRRPSVCCALADNPVDTKVIYRRYASLFFICAVSPGDNELITLEVIHRYVEVLDRYFGNVSLSFYNLTGLNPTRFELI